MVSLAFPSIPVLEKTVSSLSAKLNIPGVSMALINDAEIVWQGVCGFVDSTTSQQINDKTIFEVASLSKPLFAYAVLQLFHDEKISIDTPLIHHFSEPYTAYDFNAAEEKLNYVTARHVLAHVAGFHNWDAGESTEKGNLKFFPGNQFAYSGEAYIFLQRVFEKISGKPLANYMRDNLLIPLNMSDSSYVWKEEFSNNVVSGHGKRNDGLDSHWQEAFSAYSLYSTPTDYAKFMIAMMSGTFNTPPVLQDTYINQLMTPQIKVEPFCSWGLGWGLEHGAAGDYFWHWGDAGDSQCFALASRLHRHGMVIMTNSENGLLLIDKLLGHFFGVEHPCTAKDFLLRIEKYENLSMWEHFQKV